MYLKLCSTCYLNFSACPLTFILIKVMRPEYKGLYSFSHSTMSNESFIRASTYFVLEVSIGLLEAASDGYCRESELFQEFTVLEIM